MNGFGSMYVDKMAILCGAFGDNYVDNVDNFKKYFFIGNQRCRKNHINKEKNII